MKKMFFIAALAVFGMTSADAQVSFGVKAGPQLTNLIGDDADGIDSKVGFNVGGYANIRFSEQLAFQPELQFSAQGGKFEGRDLGVDYKVKYNFSNINVPLMMKWYAYDGLNFEFGPQVGFNVAAKTDWDYDTPIDGVDGSGKRDIEDAETVDFGLNIGAGYELPSGLNFGIRYTHGLTDVIKDVDVKHSVIALGVGYTF